MFSIVDAYFLKNVDKKAFAMQGKLNISNEKFLLLVNFFLVKFPILLNFLVDIEILITGYSKNMKEKPNNILLMQQTSNLL